MKQKIFILCDFDRMRYFFLKTRGCTTNPYTLKYSFFPIVGFYVDENEAKMSCGEITKMNFSKIM